MIPNIRSVAARALRTDAPLFGVSLAGVSKVFAELEEEISSMQDQ